MNNSTNTCTISIADKALFDSYIKKALVTASELNFTNLFIWRKYYDIEFIEYEGFLNIISKGTIGKPFCFFPIGDYSDKSGLVSSIEMLKRYFFEKDWHFVMSRVSKEQLNLLLECFADKVIYEEDRANFDYIYSYESMSSLAGKKLDGKRNHINKFKKLYSSEYILISEKDINDCKDIMENWIASRKEQDDTEISTEKTATYELLDNFSELNVKGAIVLVNGKPEAFTIGEMTANETVVVHVEKANASIQGLYPFINQQFLVNAWQGAKYVNREQDLGIEGLRKAKLSYNPVHFIEKFTVRDC